MGNITKIIDTVTNNTINYTYDNIGRLTREDNLKLGKTKMWTYDSYGNISSSKEGTYTLSTLTSATTYSYGYNSNFPNRLTNYNGNSVSYDANGNMTILGSYKFTWARGRLLDSCTKAGMNYTFTYDARGLRTVKYHGAVDYTNYIYDSKKLISEHRVSGNDQFDLHYIYAGNEIIGFVYQNKNYYYIKNVQGDIIKLVDNFNNVVATYVYDAWGNHKVYNANGVENTSSSWIGNINPFRYRGYYYDVETGLFWCNSRYYNPEWGRWISPDSIEYLDPQSINGLNLYAYCMNDPVNMYDPSGCAPEWLGWVLTGVALVGLTALTVLSLGTAAPITGVAAGVIIGATCGAYAGAITSVVSQGISNGWDNISSWEVLKQTGIGTLSGAISGLGAGIGTTVLTGGIAQVTSGLLDGSIDSFSDGLVQFALGGMLSGLTYGLGKIVSNKFAASKISSVLGNSSKNSIINKRLAAAGFNNLKVGVDGMSGVVNYLYKYYGYQAISSIVSGIAGGGISFIGGIM